MQAIDSASVSFGSIAVDSSGNVILAGAYSGTLRLATNSTLSTLAANLTPNAGGNDAFVVKYNASGVGQWVQRIGGGYNDNFNSVAVDSSGNIVAAGYFSGTTTGLTSPVTNLTANGSGDAFVVKYNASGVSQWAQRVGGPWGDSFTSVAVDSGDNVVVVGSFTDTTTGLSPIANLTSNGGTADAFVVKYNTSGVSQWAQRVGGSSNDNFNSVAVDSSGNIVAAGSFKGTTTGLSPVTNLSTNGSSVDAFVVKYNASGVSQWAQRVGGSSTDGFNSVAVDSSGNIVAAGSFTGTTTGLSSPATNLTSIGSGACIIVRYDSSGTSQWAGSFGGLSSSSITHVSVNGNEAWATGFVDSSQSAPFGHTRLVGKFAIGWSGFPVSTPAPGVSSALAWGGSGAANTGVALGSSAFASAQGSTAFGVSSATAQNAFAAGSSLAQGAGATAFGERTLASGVSATAMGISTTASGSGATAMGISSTASGTYSTAMGLATQASGNYSTAMGMFSKASGSYSTAMGFSSTASGSYSTAIGGVNSTASGENSTAMGNYSTASAYASLAAGYGNVSHGSATTWVATDDLFVIGNSGSSTNKSNALAVHKNGNTRIAGKVESKGGFRTPPMGDLSMGSFTAGTNPAALSTDPLPGLNAGLRYPNE